MFILKVLRSGLKDAHRYGFGANAGRVGTALRPMTQGNPVDGRLRVNKSALLRALTRIRRDRNEERQHEAGGWPNRVETVGPGLRPAQVKEERS